MFNPDLDKKFIADTDVVERKVSSEEINVKKRKVSSLEKNIKRQKNIEKLRGIQKYNYKDEIPYEEMLSILGDVILLDELVEYATSEENPWNALFFSHTHILSPDVKNSPLSSKIDRMSYAYDLVEEMIENKKLAEAIAAKNGKRVNRDNPELDAAAPAAKRQKLKD